ncbi:glycoside hydrolase family 36 protein [bacterium]
MHRIVVLVMGFIFMGCVLTCTPTQSVVETIDGSQIRIVFNDKLHSQVYAKFDGKIIALGDFSPSEYVEVSGETQNDFMYRSMQQEYIEDDTGKGHRYLLMGETASIRKQVTITLYEDFPAMAFYQVSYTNIGQEDLTVNAWVNHALQIQSKGKKKPAFWSFQSGSYEERPDWILPLEQGFNQENYLGMNATDYGGGTPVSAVWRRDVGLATGHVEMVPKLVSLPISLPDTDAAHMAVQYKVNQILPPNMSLITFQTFIAVYQGDYFAPLSEYSRFMQTRGVQFDPVPETAYEPIWCAWGFQRNFTMDQIYGALPKAKELGFEWAVLDDGWQTAEGDWYLVKDKFPRGDADMQNLVDEIHRQGLKAKLWWAPLAVDPGTDLIKKHEDYLLLNVDGSTQDISWWNAYYLCPAYKKVLDFTQKQVETIMKKWGFDGLKIDGQHLNLAPPCYNPKHKHARPEASVEDIPEFFKMIYKTALSINPEAVVEICPCGTAYNFHTMPFMNQPVASDPTSSWQIRLKGKTFKALMGPHTAYYGDHVELSDERSDFASTVGIGGVIGTKFTWPEGAKKGSKIDLTPEKEAVWKKWVDIYLEKMLPKGTYLGHLYDLGFDRPETHAIRKNGRLYYAFYAAGYSGFVELRGLGDGSYHVVDYVNNTDYGLVNGPQAKLEVQFQHALLLEARNEERP